MSRHPLVRGLAVSVIGLSLAALSGCGSPITRFYALTPVAKAPDRTPTAASQLTVGVRSVELPAELDRAQIVTRTGANTVHLAEFHRWSGPLRDSVARVIAENLAVQLQTELVVVYPWPPGASPDHEVVVDITRLDGQLRGTCTLDARWRVVAKRENQPPVFGRSSLTETVGADYVSLVAAESRLLGALSGEIAAAIRNGVAMKR